MFSFFKKKEYKLTPIQELLLALLRAQLWLKPVDEIVLPSTPEEWDELINLGYKQTVICFIAKACLRHPDVDNIPTEIKDEFEAVLEENKRIHEHHNVVLIELITKFEELGLHPILLKGQGIAHMYDCIHNEECASNPDGFLRSMGERDRECLGTSNSSFSNDGENSLASRLLSFNSKLRQCGDIDLYFRREEYEQAEAYIKTIEDDNDEHIINYNHYETHYKGMTIEIHKHTSWIPNPFANKRLQQFADEEMRHPDTIRIEGKEINIPSPIYNLVSVFVHMWHHFEDRGVSLRQMCDVAVLTQYYYGDCSRSKVGVQQLETIIDNISHLKFWKISGCIFEKYLGLSKNTLCMYDKTYEHRANLMLGIVLTDGAFNYKSEAEITEGTTSFYKKRWRKHDYVFEQIIYVYPISGYSIFWRYLQIRKSLIYKICTCLSR